MSDDEGIKKSDGQDIIDKIGALFLHEDWNNVPEIKKKKKRSKKVSSIHSTGRTDENMKERKGRMINKEISDSDKFASLSPEAAVLFCMLIPHYNSYGKMNGGSGYVKDEVCPKVPYLNPETIPVLLQEISQKTNVKYFSCNGRFWIHSLSFLTKHQELREDRMGSDRLPNYSESSDSVQEKSGINPGETENPVIHENHIELQGDIGNLGLIQEKSGTNPGEVSLEVKDKIKIKIKDKIKDKAAGGAKESAFILPDWIQKEAWDGYEEMRKKKRAPMTDRARMIIIKKLQEAKDNNQDPNAMLDQSTEKSWTGIFEVKGVNKNAGSGTTTSASGTPEKAGSNQAKPGKYANVGKKLS